jgi:hypothetical protein
VDLNTNNYITGTGPSYPSPGTPIPVGWENIVTLGSPGVNPELIGRIAYWVDDESTKANVNLAQKRANDTAGYTPAAIDLSVPQLFGGSANSIISYVTGTRPFDTIESLKLTPIPAINYTEFSKDQFFVTVNSTSPDLTPWGSKRLNLGDFTPNLGSMAQKQAAVVAIAGALSTNTMTTWYGKTFADKYTLPNVNQIAANIVGYLSKDLIPADSSTAGSPLTDTTVPQYLGLKETPYINELVITCTFTVTPTTPPAGQLTITPTISTELWYMYTNSAGWNPPPNTQIVIPALPTVSVPGNSSLALNTAPIVIKTGIKHMAPSPGNASGTYLVIGPQPLPSVSINVPNTAAVPVSLNAGLITAILTSSLGRMDFAQIKMAFQANNTMKGAAPTVLTWSSQCNDPRVKPVNNDWTQNFGANTLGLQNSPNVLNMSAGNGGTLPGDGDISCHIVSANVPNSNLTGPQSGVMHPSELAYIHTGVPWRTLWLEPQQTVEGNNVPDWLAVDLFSTTDLTNVPGRMNINARMSNGSGTAGVNTIPQRQQPLDALLGNAGLGHAGNIYSAALDPQPSLPSAFAPSVFTTAGQVCEVNGLADGGGAKSTRELPAQQILNIITPRSDTFTIWAIAQSIKKVQPTPATAKIFIPPPSGGDFVSGEVKVQAVVQRYEYPNALAGGLPVVRFRTLYYRYIYQ